MSVPLSTGTRRRLEALFTAPDAAQAERLLVERCAGLPLWHDDSPSGLERVRFAALRLSGGDIERLESAVELAHIDWRDLLVAAGFAEDPQAHGRWDPLA